MKITILTNLVLYAFTVLAAPQTPPTLDTFKLRVWNYPQLYPRYSGYVELDQGQVSFNITPGFPGFDAYLDPTAPGTLREVSTGLYGALFPTSTAGLYTFSFIADPTTPGALTVGFSFRRQGCGNCGGLYLDYRESDDDLAAKDFLLMPNAEVEGSWRVYYNDYSVLGKQDLPVGSKEISLLR